MRSTLVFTATPGPARMFTVKIVFVFPTCLFTVVDDVRHLSAVDDVRHLSAVDPVQYLTAVDDVRHFSAIDGCP